MFPGGDDATSKRLEQLLDRDPQEWRSALDRRYSALDDVLEGRLPAVVYPAGRVGRSAANRLRASGVRVVALGDRNPTLQGTLLEGLPVVSPSQIAAEHRSDAILVATTLFDSAICEELRGRGCERVVPVGYLNLRLPEVFSFREYNAMWNAVTDAANRADIEAAFSLLEDDESRRVFAGKLAYHLSLDKQHLDRIKSERTIYFDSSVYNVGTDEVVVDGGAFVGDTLQSFLIACRGQFGAYFAFEPDNGSYSQLSTLVATNPSRVTAVHAGLSLRTSSARLLSTHGVDSRLLADEEAGGEDIEVVSLDQYFQGRALPSLIKMDVEGAEADALLGARGLLESARPLLAISAYHYPTDLWTLPLLINRLMPGSQFFFRHYTREVDDTVCYAIPG